MPKSSASEIVVPPEWQRLGLHPSQVRLLALMQAMGHGLLTEVKVADGLPVFVKEVQTHIRLV